VPFNIKLVIYLQNKTYFYKLILCILYKDTPACFQLDSEVEWNNGRRENCKEPSMTITSMSFLGLPFRETTEIWTIHVPFKIIHFHIIEFQVACSEYIKPYFSKLFGKKVMF
jgi:hypothetical protein